MQAVVKTSGIVDLHFHGAFGLDLMTIGPKELDELSMMLWTNGIAAFCPTTLSAPMNDLKQALKRLGHWIRARSPHSQGALPLGIHLEGPYLSPKACGAHPESAIRPFSLSELEKLWEISLETLRIITIAPEILSSKEATQLQNWSQKHRIRLSIGHSRATEDQAFQALRKGFTGITHLWNAMSFHHREPGIVGAALDRKGIYVELILDQVHVAPTTIRWVRKLHPAKQVCFISDCVPAAYILKDCSFGPLTIQWAPPVCKLNSGALAGGGLLLSDSYKRWFKAELKVAQSKPKELFLESIPSLTDAPLAALGLNKSRLKHRKLRWTVHSAGVDFVPLEAAREI